MNDNGHPEVLARKLESLFPNPSRRAEAVRILRQYGAELHEREADRVRLAILKLAGKKLERIRKAVETAKKDYRDILAYAEYPNQMVHDSWKLTAAQNQALVDSDREQYERWKKL
jgi:DNA repair photolyase